MHDRNNRIEISIFFSSSKDEILIDLLNVDELNKIKTKRKSRKSKNKKKTQTRTKKTATRFNKRNFSKFEHVKRKIETQIKRVKKKIVDEITKDEERNKDRKREREDRAREERDEKRDEKQREQKHHENAFDENIRAKTSASKTSKDQSIEKIVVFTFDKFVRNERSSEQLNQRLREHEKNFMMLSNNINDNDYDTKNFESEHSEDMNM